MTDEQRRALDDETIRELRATSSTDASWRAAHEERIALAAYDFPGRLRWGAPVCGSADCFGQFTQASTGRPRIYCSRACWERDYYRRRGERYWGSGVTRSRRAAIRATVRARLEEAA